jgi:hypothetical protein
MRYSAFSVGDAVMPGAGVVHQNLRVEDRVRMGKVRVCMRPYEFDYLRSGAVSVPYTRQAAISGCGLRVQPRIPTDRVNGCITACSWFNIQQQAVNTLPTCDRDRGGLSHAHTSVYVCLSHLSATICLLVAAIAAANED